MAQPTETETVISIKLNEQTELTIGAAGTGSALFFALNGTFLAFLANDKIEAANSQNLQTTAGVIEHNYFMGNVNVIQTLSNINFMLVPVALVLAAISTRVSRAPSRR